MIHQFSIGDQIYIPTYDELKTLGWIETFDGGMGHPDISLPFIINSIMYKEFGGKWATIFAFTPSSGIYMIKEDDQNWRWPLELLNTQWNNISCQHEEGMTPIGGWVICRICGDNLKKI